MIIQIPQLLKNEWKLFLLILAVGKLEAVEIVWLQPNLYNTNKYFIPWKNNLANYDRKYLYGNHIL